MYKFGRVLQPSLIPLWQLYSLRKLPFRSSVSARFAHQRFNIYCGAASLVRTWSAEKHIKHTSKHSNTPPEHQQHTPRLQPSVFFCLISFVMAEIIFYMCCGSIFLKFMFVYNVFSHFGIYSCSVFLKYSFLVLDVLGVLMFFDVVLICVCVMFCCLRHVKHANYLFIYFITVTN